MKDKLKKLGKRFGRFFFTFSLCFVFVYYSTISVAYADWTTDVGEWISDNPDSPVSEGFMDSIQFIQDNYDSIDTVVDAGMETAIALTDMISNTVVRDALKSGLLAIQAAAANGNKLEDVTTETVVNEDMKPGAGAVAFSNVNWSCGNGSQSWDVSTYYGDENNGWRFNDFGSICTLSIWGSPNVIPSRLYCTGSGGLNSKWNCQVTQPYTEYNGSAGLNFDSDGTLYNMHGTGSSPNGFLLEIKVNGSIFGHTTTCTFGYYHTSSVTVSPVSFISAFRSGLPGRPVPSDFTQAEIDNGDYVRSVIVYDYVNQMLEWLEDVQGMPEYDVIPYTENNVLGFIPYFWLSCRDSILNANPSDSFAKASLLKSSKANLSTPRSFIFDFDGVTVPLHDNLVFSMPEFHLWINGFGTDTLYWDANGDAGYVTIPGGLIYLWDVLAYFVAVMWTYVLMRTLFKHIVKSSGEGGDGD